MNGSDCMPPTTDAVFARRPRTVRRLGRSGSFVVAAALVVPLLTAPAALATTTPVRPIVSGWGYFSSTSSSASTSLLGNTDLFTDVSPFWYTAKLVSGAPSVVAASYASNKATVLPQLQATHVPVIPTVTDGMGATGLATVLADGTKRAALVSQLTNLVLANAYAGVDLDFETMAFNSKDRALWPTTRVNWDTFVAGLAASLHSHGKLLSVTTPYMGSDTTGYWVYDWKGIGPYVDRLRIMLYDYHVSAPGPIAPLSWVNDVLSYAVTAVASMKIQLGVPAYGRDWYQSTTGTCPAGSSPDLVDHSVTAASYRSWLASRGATPTWDGTNGEWTASYTMKYGTDPTPGPTTCLVSRQGWYDDSRAISARAKLVGTYQLRGIAMWTIGGEDPATWSLLRSYAATIAPTPTTVTVAAPAVTSYGQRVLVTGTARSGGLPVVGATASLMWERTGTTTWSTLARAATDATGVARFAPTVGAAGTYRIVVTGTWARAAGAGNAAPTAMRTRVVAVPSATSIRAGTKVTLSVTLGPPRKGQKVARQRYVSGRWTTLAVGYASSTGHVTFSFTPTTRSTTYTYRVVAYGYGTVSTGYSPMVTIRTT